MMIYILAESITIGAILWAAWNSWRYHVIARKLESIFGKIYCGLLFLTCVWWLVGAGLRFEWAIKGSWRGLWDVWTIKWLGWWLIAALGNGFRTDMEIQASEWEHWRDIMRSESLMSRKGVRSLIFIASVSGFIAVVIFIIKSTLDHI